MSVKTFSDIILQPSLLKTTTLSELELWVKIYPHIPILRAMLASKAMHESNAAAAHYLEQAAVYVQDRKKLKQLIQKWQLLQSEVEVIEPSVSELEQNEEVIAVENEVEEIIESAIISLEEVELKEEISTEVEVESDVEIVSEGINIDEIEEVVSETIKTDEEIQVEEVITNAEPEENILPEIQQSEENSTEETSVEIEEIQVSNNFDEQTDEEFLRLIGFATPNVETKDHDVDLEAEAPGKDLPLINENDTIDTGLAAKNMDWLLPWVEEFNFPTAVFTKKISTPEVEKPMEVQAKVEEIPAEKKHKNITVKKNKSEIEQSVSYQKLETKNINTSTEKESPILENKTLESKPEKELSSTHSFEEWLNILAEQKNKAGEKPVFDLPQPDYTKALESTPAQMVNKPISPIEEPESMTESEVKKMAEESLSMNSDMGTETLAKIFIKQGKIKAAISIYENLKEKYPEKSSYFAAQISSIKQE